MPPAMKARIDAEYPLYDFSSRSELVCKAVEFYLGYLHSESDAEYVSKTSLAFMETQFAKLEARMCKQLFRICVELSMVAHLSASQIKVDDKTLKKLHNQCIKDIKSTVGNINYDKIYAYQNPDFKIGAYLNEDEN